MISTEGNEAVVEAHKQRLGVTVLKIGILKDIKEFTHKVNHLRSVRKVY